MQYTISLAHSRAVREYRAAKQEGYLLDDSRIGLINCFTPPYTRENPSAADLEAVRMTDGVCNRWWLDLVTKGELPQDVIDNWSWANAFKNRYGFVEVDLEDGYNRRPKKSAAWLKQVATTHVVD